VVPAASGGDSAASAAVGSMMTVAEALLTVTADAPAHGVVLQRMTVSFEMLA
jgi:hypothetical protein